MRLALARLLACGIPHSCTTLAYGEPPATSPLLSWALFWKSAGLPLQTGTLALGRSSVQPFLLNQAPHRVTRSGASVEPNLKPLWVNLHLNWISQRVIRPNNFEELTVSRRFGIRNDNPVKWFLLGSFTGQSNSCSHILFLLLYMKLGDSVEMPPPSSRIKRGEEYPLVVDGYRPYHP